MHIITVDLWIIEHKKLCKIISKGPSYKEPKNDNWKKVNKPSWKAYTIWLKEKFYLIIRYLRNLLYLVSQISKLKSRIKPSKSNPSLKKVDALPFIAVLKNSKKKFVLVSIDKASRLILYVNDITFKYYWTKLALLDMEITPTVKLIKAVMR